MHIHCLQHVPFEDPGYILEWADVNGHQLTFTRFFNQERLPTLDEIDFLIILGGPMSVHDDPIYPWMQQEKRFIKSFINLHNPILGICLGAQLVAEALGASIYPNEEKEIGWFSIQKVPTRDTTHVLTLMPKRLKVFHWHGETFDIPDGAIRLARSEACVNQAFLYRNNILGLQFHLEMTANGVKNLLQHCSSELTDGVFIQNGDSIKNESDFFDQNRLFISSVLDDLVNGIQIQNQRIDRPISHFVH